MRNKKPERDAQLASLVKRELRMIIECAENPRINQLEVLEIQPERGGKHFRIFFGPPAHDPELRQTDPQGKQALEHLERARGYIRSELMAVLAVKRCPDLSFYPEPLAWAAPVAGDED